MEIVVREAGLDEAEAIARLDGIAFHGDVDVPTVRRALRTARRVGAYDGEQLVGFAAACPLELSVPGGAIACAGVTWVSVAPTHRRRGILRRLMATLLGGLDAPVAALWASEGGIYERFGFRPAVTATDLWVDAGGPLALRAEPDPAPIRLRTPEEALGELVALDGRLWARRGGRLRRDATWWTDRVLSGGYRDGVDVVPRTPTRVALLGPEGAATGYAIYRVAARWRGEPHPHRTAEIRALEAETPAGEAALWRFVTSLDMVGDVTASLRPPDDPLLLLAADGEQVREVRRSDTLWLALLDPAAALAGRAFAADADLVLGLDGQRGRLTVAGGQARWSGSTDPVDLELTRADLASLYLGGRCAGALVAAGLAREARPGAAATLDAALAVPRAPHTPDVF